MNAAPSTRRAEEVTYHRHYNIGIAVAAPAGLISRAGGQGCLDKKDVLAVATEIERLSKDVRARPAQAGRPEGRQAFTVTSIGSIGGLISTPIINHPEVGIVGVGKVRRPPAGVRRPQRAAAGGPIRWVSPVVLVRPPGHRPGRSGRRSATPWCGTPSNPATLPLPERFG